MANNKLRLKSIKEYLKSSRFNIISFWILIITLIVYIVLLVFFIVNKLYIKTIISVTADYVSIVSCFFVVIQLFVFVNDSRHSEARSGKEAALEIAKGYSSDVLPKISFIQNVLCINYNEKDYNKLIELIDDIDTVVFTSVELAKKKELYEYSKVFQNGNNNIDYNLIKSQSVAHQILNLSDLCFIEEKTRKLITNLRFKSLICDTMNTLEYYAMSINHHVAESDMLFDSLHQSYLRFVKLMYPYICQYNIDDELYFPNVIALYNSWNTKVKSIDIYKKEEEKKIQEVVYKKRHTSNPL